MPFVCFVRHSIARYSFSFMHLCMHRERQEIEIMFVFGAQWLWKALIYSKNPCWLYHPPECKVGYSIDQNGNWTPERMKYDFSHSHTRARETIDFARKIKTERHINKKIEFIRLQFNRFVFWLWMVLLFSYTRITSNDWHEILALLDFLLFS